MKENKKGSIPKDTTKDHIYSNRLQNVCLILFIIFAGLIIAGEYLHNETLTCTSFGCGIAIILIHWILGDIWEDEK